VAGVKPDEFTVRLIATGIMADWMTISTFPLYAFPLVALNGSLLEKAPLAMLILHPGAVTVNWTVFLAVKMELLSASQMSTSMQERTSNCNRDGNAAAVCV
jgi:hypothetical protein